MNYYDEIKIRIIKSELYDKVKDYSKDRNKVKSYIPMLQEIAKSISEIDVLCAFATVTEENNYIR